MRRVFLAVFFVISVISLSAREYKMGCKFVNPENIPWMKEAEVDIKRSRADSVDYSHGMPPIMWQYLGSCTACATGYYYKAYQEYVEHDGWDMNSTAHQFEPKFIYNLINGGEDGGAYISDAFKCLCDLGVAPKASVSYSNYDSTSWPSQKGFNDAIAFRCYESFYLDISDDTGIEQLKQHMANDNDCAVISISVWGPFWNGNLGNHIYDTGDITGGNWGGHALCLVGYNDSLTTPDGKGAFRLVNSWGTGWEDNGYAWITYEAIKNSSICRGYAYYATDRRNYKPTKKIAYKISHNDRFDLRVRFDVLNQWISSTRFNWYQPTKIQHPYPDNHIILDVSDGAEYISPFECDTVRLRVYDGGNDGISGTIEDYLILDQDMGFYFPSVDTPKNMVDYGYTTVDAITVKNQTHWQSFQRLSDNSGSIERYSQMDSSSILWSYPTGDSILSSPVIGDIDGDGVMEIVVGSNDDSVYAINGDGSRLWAYYMGGNVLGAPALGDLIGDGNLDVVVASDNYTVSSMKGADGTLNWSTGTWGGVYSSPAINSIDGDRKLEVVVGGYCMRILEGENGGYGWFNVLGNPSVSSPAVGDIFDDDGILDVAMGNGDSLLIFNGRNGSITGVFNTSGAVKSSPLIADINCDTLMEVIFGSCNDTLYAIRMDSLLWKFGTSGDIISSPAIADIDNDGINEIVFGSDNGSIYSLNANNGSLNWSHSTGGAVRSSPAIADMDSNGVLDIVVGSMDGKLYCLDGNNSLLWSLNLSTPIKSSPALGDIDNDGLLEVAVGGIDGKLYLIDDYTAGISERTGEKLFLSRMNKPITEDMNIRFSIPERGEVKLVVIDAAGREIRRPVNGIVNSGYHEVNVKTDELPLGVYFYRMEYMGSSITRKALLIK